MHPSGIHSPSSVGISYYTPRLCSYFSFHPSFTDVWRRNDVIMEPANCGCPPKRPTLQIRPSKRSVQPQQHSRGGIGCTFYGRLVHGSPRKFCELGVSHCVRSIYFVAAAVPMEYNVEPWGVRLGRSKQSAGPSFPWFVYKGVRYETRLKIQYIYHYVWQRVGAHATRVSHCILVLGPVRNCAI